MTDNTYTLNAFNTILTVRPAQFLGNGDLHVCKVDGGDPELCRVYQSRPGNSFPGPNGEYRAPNGSFRLVPSADKPPVVIGPDTPIEFGEIIHIEWP